MSFTPDDKGYFIIKIDRDKNLILSEHYDNGHMLISSTVSHTAKTAFINISTLDVFREDHLKYLERELKRAERCLLCGTNYEQDEEN